MIKKRPIVKKFTRPVKSDEALSPSDFKVLPRFVPRSYEDSPIEDIMSSKSLEERPNEQKKEVKAVAPDETASIDREKIRRIAKKLSLLKQLDLENKKRAQEDQYNSKNKKELSEKNNSPPIIPPPEKKLVETEQKQKFNGSFKKSFLNPKTDNIPSQEEVEKKKKILDSEEITEIPDLPEEE
jgi:hypothetical protein